jgi:tetratricopeptide (TPR) repeat protein
LFDSRSGNFVAPKRGQSGRHFANLTFSGKTAEKDFMTANTRFALVNDINNLRTMVELQLAADDIRAIYFLRPLATLYSQTGALEEAAELQRKIHSLCLKYRGNPLLPTVEEARKALASTLQSLKLYAEAIPLFETLVADDQDEKLYGALVECLQNVGRFSEAIAICESMVARFEKTDVEKGFGGHVSWLTSLSRCYSRQDDYASAAAVMERTVPVMAARAEVLCIPQLDVLAELYRKAGNEAAHDAVRAKRREIAERCDY